MKRHIRIKKQQEGFLKTGSLFTDRWFDSNRHYISSFQLPVLSDLSVPKVDEKLPLGKRAEVYFKTLIEGSGRYSMLGEEIQLISEGITMGALDFLVRDDVEQQNIHVELAYKVYLQDKSISDKDEFACWIGPNRKDSLADKLRKLWKRQFPILHDGFTQDKLKELGLPDFYQQQLCLKAKLFISWTDWISRKARDPFVLECLEGWWMTVDQFQNSTGMFEGVQFYIPTKHDWMIRPEANLELEWFDFEELQRRVVEQVVAKNSPMIWLKREGRVESFFVVWWV